MYKSVLRV